MREHRDKAHGIADLMNYALMPDEGIVLMKDGAFCAGWTYYGPDLNSSSIAEIEFLSASINNTLCQLGDGWMIHTDLIRKPSCDYPATERCAFPDPTSFMIDEERRAQYLAESAHFESTYTFVITYLPPTDAQSKFKKLFVQGESKSEIGWEKLLAIFKHKIEHLENFLSKSLILKRMNNEELLTHFHTCITGLHHHIRMPKIPVYLDILLGTQDLLGGMYPKIGNHFIRVIALSGFPLEIEPGMLSVLEQLPISFRWSNRFILLDPQTAIAELKKYRRNWFQKRHGLKGLIKEAFSPGEGSGFQNRDALAMAEDADAAIEEAESGIVRYGFYTSVIILMGENAADLDNDVKLIIKNFEMRGFQGRMETINAMESYIGSLPGHGYQNIRKPPIHSLHLADLLPLTSVWPGLEQNPCRYYPNSSPPLLYAATSGSTPFRFNLHVNDIGHTLILGDTGAGKSTLVGTLIAQFFRYPNAQVFLFDKGYSAYILCKAMGGEHYDIASSENDKYSPAFFPLGHIDKPGELDAACEWVEILLECQHIKITSAHRKEIRDSLIRLSAQASRTLTDYQSTVQNQDIKNAVEFYTLSGQMGNVLDAQSDGLREARLQVFEMKHLMEKGLACTTPTILYLFHQIEKRLKGQPTLIIVEEGHTFLKGQFGERLDKWLRELRKQNVSVIFLTQSLSEIVESPYKHILLNSCNTKLFLPNQNADNALNAELYNKVGLTDRQISLLKSAQPKRDYYYTSSLGKRLIDLGLGKVILSFVGVDSEEDRRRVDALEREHADQWVYHWLKQRGLNDWAEYWLNLYLVFQKSKGVVHAAL